MPHLQLDDRGGVGHASGWQNRPERRSTGSESTWEARPGRGRPAHSGASHDKWPKPALSGFGPSGWGLYTPLGHWSVENYTLGVFMSRSSGLLELRVQPPVVLDRPLVSSRGGVAGEHRPGAPSGQAHE